MTDIYWDNEAGFYVVECEPCDEFIGWGDDRDEAEALADAHDDAHEMAEAN